MAAPSDEEFAELVEAAWPGLYRTAYLLLGEHQLAEDLVQTSLAKTYASWGKVREPAAAAGYARVVLANTASSWFGGVVRGSGSVSPKWWRNSRARRRCSGSGVRSRVPLGSLRNS